MKPTRPRYLVGTALAMILCTVAHADVTFSDSTFANADWGLDIVALGTGGTASAAQVSGGNPGFARQVTTSVNASGGAVYALSRYGSTVATRYDASLSGAITSVDFTIDSKWISGDGLVGQSVGIGAKQGAVVYYSALSVTGNSGLWETQSSFGLTAADFIAPAGGPAINFSATGAPIRFGFVVANSAPGPASVNTVIYDNFQVTVHSVPAPAAAGVIGIAGLASAGRRRRDR